MVLVGFGGHVVGRINPEIALFCSRFHDSLKPGEVIRGGVSVELIKQVFPESFA